MSEFPVKGNFKRKSHHEVFRSNVFSNVPTVCDFPVRAPTQFAGPLVHWAEPPNPRGFR